MLPARKDSQFEPFLKKAEFCQKLDINIYTYTQALTDAYTETYSVNFFPAEIHCNLVTENTIEIVLEAAEFTMQFTGLICLNFIHNYLCFSNPAS